MSSALKLTFQHFFYVIDTNRIDSIWWFMIGIHHFSSPIQVDVLRVCHPAWTWSIQGWAASQDNASCLLLEDQSQWASNPNNEIDIRVVSFLNRKLTDPFVYQCSGKTDNYISPHKLQAHFDDKTHCRQLKAFLWCWDRHGGLCICLGVLIHLNGGLWNENAELSMWQ